MIGEGITAVGDAVSFTALPLLVLALTGSGLMMGIVGALQTLPDLLFGVVAGALSLPTKRAPGINPRLPQPRRPRMCRASTIET